MPALGFNPINAVLRNVEFDNSFMGSVSDMLRLDNITGDDVDEGNNLNDGETTLPGAATETSQVSIDYSKTGIIYPLFGLPGQTWDDMIEYRKAHPSLPWIAIINPLNGPGGPNYVFATYVERMQDADIQVLGYVSTYWAAVPLETVKDDIDKYKEYFDVDGIFLDEMSNEREDVERYREITAHAKSAGMGYVIGNTGTDAAPDYIGVVDNIVISEGYGEPTLSRLAGWHVPHGRENFSYIAYNQHTVDPQYVTTSTHFASYVYITDDYLPNPYDKIPSHFDELLALLDPGIRGDMRNVVAKSVNLSGEPVNATLTISHESESVASGGEWVTHVGITGNTYEVTASDSSAYTFVHWEDGSVTPTRTMMLNSSSILTAYYSPRNATTEPGVTVNTMTENGAVLNMWTTVEQDGQIVESGFTPFRFSGEPGQQYNIFVADWQHRTFDRWMDGSSANPYTLNYSGESFLTAYYKYESPAEAHDTLTINTYDNDGNIITMWTTIRIGDQVADQGYTPLTIPVTRGETYTVSVADWENVIFDSWEDGSDSRQIDVTIDEAHKSVTAYYRQVTIQ